MGGPEVRDLPHAGQVRLHPRPAPARDGGEVSQGAEGPGEGDEPGGEVAGDDQGEGQVVQHQETL